jgi:fibronectin type 3 domain-containing protein
VTLSWNAVGGAASYKVYRCTASGAETLLQSGVTGTTFTDTGVTNGTAYYYKVSAVNAAGESPLSAEASATPQVSAPAAPTNLSATAVSSTQINLTWSDNSSNETGFVVERATDSGFTAGLTTANLGANATSYSATGLSAGTTYWFRVRATNAAGASANSNVASATTSATGGTGTGLAATYFDNMDFTGATVSRTDPTINFNWGTGSPSPSIGADTFSARWTGQVQAVESGSYRFQTSSDDGVRLWVNGQLLINNWTNHAPTTNTSAAVALTAGQKYDIKLEYYENTGGAVMKLLWQRPGQTTFAVIPQSQLYTPPAAGNGLRATYFANMDLTGTTVSRIDPTVNFNWGSGAPASGIGADQFSARWTGQVLAVESGAYIFRTNSDDGVRLWVNGQLLIDHWTDHAPTYDTGTITLQAGQKYDIKVEYYENTGGAVMKLEWQRPGQSGFGTIPQANLFGI